MKNRLKKNNNKIIISKSIYIASITQTYIDKYFPISALQVRPGAAFGNGSGQILMDNVACLSSEISILECDYADFNSQNCGHYEDVGVICEH